MSRTQIKAGIVRLGEMMGEQPKVTEKAGRNRAAQF
jgi:hypothetical protein